MAQSRLSVNGFGGRAGVHCAWSRGLTLAALVAVAPGAASVRCAESSAPGVDLAAAPEMGILRAGEPLKLPIGTVSWSELSVRAAMPTRGEVAEPGLRLPAEGSWVIALEAPKDRKLSRHGLVIDLLPGFRAEPGASYRAVRIEGPGPGQAVFLEAALRTADGEVHPALVLPMGDRVFVELFEVGSATRLVLRSLLARDREFARQQDSALAKAAGQPCVPVAPCTGFVQVEAGGWHSLAVTSDGEVHAWGTNGSGQLGDGTRLGRTLPVVVQEVGGAGPLTGIVQVAAGLDFSLAVTSGGEVRAWGSNGVGQLGDGTTTDSPLPLVVQGVGGGGPLTGVVQVAAGYEHSLALTSAGEVRTWGAGPLGDGTWVPSSLPVVVQAVGGGGSLTGIVQVAAGYDYSLAVTGGGEVRAWGWNDAGKLGDGTTLGRGVPVVVQAMGGGGPLTEIVQVAAGWNHSLAVTSRSEVRAWGANGSGQLGDGTTISRSLPVVVQAMGGGGPLTGIALVAVGHWSDSFDYDYSLAVTSGGEVRAWGYNRSGQLGDGTAVDRTLPVVVHRVGGGGPITGIVQVTAGDGHSLALTSAGEALAWGGFNRAGELADGTAGVSALPTCVRPNLGEVLPAFAQVAAGYDYSLALTSGGEVRAWGYNDYGQLGNGTTTLSSLPVVVQAVGGGAPLTGIVQVAAGARHALALTSGGEVRAWGENYFGQLGGGTTRESPLPVVVKAVGGSGPLTGIIQVAAGERHSLAVTSGGEVRAWGSNDSGQLGDGTDRESSRPVVVQGVGGGGPLTAIIQVAARYRSVALTSAGEVRAWGSGPLGDGRPNGSWLPVVVQAVGGGAPLTGVVQVAPGMGHFLALTGGGEVRAWGYNWNGQLGDGTTSMSLLPVVVQTVGGGGPLTGIVQVAGDFYHSLAVTSGGEARAWGSNRSGQLGDGTAMDSGLPVVVQQMDGGGPLTGVVQVAGGYSHSLAVTSGGVRAWGNDWYFQLGDGYSRVYPLPQNVLCRTCAPVVVGLKAARLGTDVTLTWDLNADSSAYNVWYVADKRDINRARLGSAPPAFGVLDCSDPASAPGTSCLDVGAVTRDPVTLFHYQVRPVCLSGIEGP